MMNLLIRTLSVVLVISGYAYAADGAKLGDPAAPLDIATWVKGEPVTIAPGNTTYVVEFWATWCPSCRASIPHLTQLQEKYGDKNVVFVSISAEDVNTVQTFVEQVGDRMGYTVAVDNNNATTDGFMKPYDLEGFPTIFIVNKEGRVAWFDHYVGDLEPTLVRVLEGTYDIAAAQHERELEAERQRLYSEFIAACRQGDTDRTKAMAEQMMKEHSASPELMSVVAWAFLFFPNRNVRDPELALKMSKISVDASEGKSPAALNTYARALFVNGDVDGAIEQQKKAIALVPESVRAKFEQPLNEYLASKNEGSPSG